MSKTLAGDSGAFAVLVERWTPRIATLCRARVGRWQMAEDLAQESFLKAFERLRSLQAPEKFGAWVAEIATHACQDWLKAKERGQRVVDPTLPEGLLDRQPARQEEGDDRLDALVAAVDSLPTDFREVLWLYYREKRTYLQIAEMLDTSVATVNARLTRARALLRERLGVPLQRKQEAQPERAKP